MEALWNAIKSLAIWQVIVLLVALFGSAGAVYFFYADTTGTDSAQLSENQQLIPIRYGDIVNQVSTNGNVAFPERETLRFGIAGVLGQVLVEEGQRVAVGQEVARLDSSSIASLEETVARLRVDLLQAEEDLALLLEPRSPVVMAQERAAAREVVAAARYEAQLAEEALAEVLEPEVPTFLDLKTLKERIAATELLIEQREEERDDLLNPELPTEQEVKAQEELVADARLKLQEAIEARDLLQSRNLQPDYEMKVAESRQKQADAEKELADIEEALADLEPSERELLEATQNRLKAQIALDEAILALDDFIQSQGSDLTNRRKEKLEIETEIAGASDTLASLKEAYDSGTLGLAFNISRWEQYLSALEEELHDVRSGIVSQVEELESNLAVAQANLLEAEENLAELGNGPDSLERESLEARAKTIIANREVVDRDLSELEEPAVDPLELALAQARIVLAEATLAQAIADLEELREALEETPNRLELELNLQQRELAEATLAQHLEDYAELLEEQKTVPEPLDVSLKESRIALALADLAKAEEALADLLEDQQTPPDTLDIAQAEQAIASVRVELEEAELKLESSVIVSPMDGLALQVLADPGDEIEPRTDILEIVDPRIVEVDGIVDEIDVLLVRVGTTAEVTLDALPTTTIPGVVTEIAAEAQNQQGVVTYPIRVRLNVPEGLEPRDGLSAVANIVLREERNVLLVPQQALYGSFDQPVVRVMTDGGVSEIPVELGSSDDFWVAVNAGLAEGDQIVLEGSEISASEFSFRNLRRATGGSFGPSRGGSGSRR